LSHSRSRISILLIGAFVLTGLYSSPVLSQKLSYKNWSAKLGKSFPASSTLQLEGLLALYRPQKDVDFFYTYIHASRKPAQMRVDLIDTHTHLTLIYQNKKLYRRSPPSKGHEELIPRPNTLNDLLSQFLKLFLGEEIQGSLITENKFNWLSRFESPKAQWLEAYPFNPQLDLESIKIRIDENGRINLIRLMDPKKEKGFLYEVKSQGYLPKTKDLLKDEIKIDEKAAREFLKKINS